MAITYFPLISGTCGRNFFGSITLTFTGGTAPYTVNWVTPSLGTDVGVISSTRNFLTAGSYVISVTDSSSPLVETLNFTLQVDDGICCSISNITNTSCSFNNGTVTAISSSSGSTSGFTIYTSSDVLVENVPTTSNTIEFIGLSSGTYYVVAFNNFGCSGKSETFIINPSTELNYGLYVVPNATCGVGDFGKIFVTGLTGTPPYTYNWSNGKTGSTITGLTQGSYSVNVTDGLGCSKIQSAEVTLVESLGLVSITSVAPTCLQNNGSITFNFTGGTLPYYYQTSNGVYNITFSPNIQLTNLAAGNYTINVTDASLCQISATSNLATPSGLTSVNVFTTNSLCSNNDGTITVVLEGGNSPYTYTLIYPNSDTQTTTQNATTNIFSNLSGGTYTLIVNDFSGCTYTNDYFIQSDDAFTIEVSSTGSTFNKNNGIIEITKTTGGTEPFNYLLDGNVVYGNTSLSSVTISNVSPGQHEVKVSDSNKCFQTQNVVISTQPVVDFFLNIKSDGTISGNTLTALISDGQPPFTYHWSDNVPNNPQAITATGLTAGTYSLTVVDNNLSSLKRTITIPGSRAFSSYGIFTVAQQEFTNVDNTKYSLSKMFNEGFQDITSGNTNCVLSSATFTAQVEILPFGTTTNQLFYTSTSLLTAPPDNIWYDAIKSLLLQTIGVKDVVINESDNTLTIVSDRARSEIIDGTYTAVNLKVYLIIDYNINCSG